MYVPHMGENLEIIIAVWQTNNKENTLRLEMYTSNEVAWLKNALNKFCKGR